MAGSAGRATSDSPGAQQLLEAADAAKEAAEADNLLDPVEVDRSVTAHYCEVFGFRSSALACIPALLIAEDANSTGQ